MVTDLDTRFARGDAAALREAFDVHGPLVLGMARKIVGADAEDVVQQVFLAAWRTRERFDPERGALAGWLAGITKFKAIDHLRARSRKVRTVGDEVLEHMGPNEPIEESLAERLADRMMLTEAITRLPEERRQILTMAFYGGLTHAEIADETGLPLGTVKSHVRRGLVSLRRELEIGDERA